MRPSHIRRTVCLVTTLAAIVTLSAPPAADAGQGLRDRLRKAIDKKGGASEAAPDGPNAIDQNGLRNILPQWDPRKHTSEQFPHVAVTVLKAPDWWAGAAFTGLAGEGDRVPGCFTLQLRVWSDAQTSKVVGPFDWCSERDSQLRPGSRSNAIARAGALNSSLQTSVDQEYYTGITRTEGPRPPDTVAPNDPQTREFTRKSNPRGVAYDLSDDIQSRLGHMFFNLRTGMGETFEDSDDRRVWLVEIVNPAGPRLVAPGTLSAPLVAKAPAGARGGVGLQIPCPADPAVMKQMTVLGYRCTNGFLVNSAVPGGAGAAPAATGFAPGDVVAAKIANVKLQAEPKDAAKAVGTVSPTDSLVVLAPERDGFLNVQGAAGTGWVKTILVGKK
jgi:hypothetical protein